MESQTLKIVTIMFFGLVGIVWMILSIRAGVMIDLPQWIQWTATGLLTGKYVDGRLGKIADRAQNQATAQPAPRE